MEKRNIAVLLTCHNRKAKTIDCLTSLFQATIPQEYLLDFYLTDDGSTDGTGDAVEELFPQVRVINGDGNLFWAGGMRLAWATAMREKRYDAYLLLNDDVELYPDFFMNLLEAEAFSLKKTGKSGIYSGVTVDGNGEVTYGGSKVNDYLLVVRLNMLSPAERPQACGITNANVLWVSKEVVDEIGIFDDRFTHGIADYDYSFQATRKKIPVFLAPGICGVCADDHGRNWKGSQYPLKDRIAYLKSPKGLAYEEYLYYIGRHFPLFVPYSFIMLWMKTLFPTIWDHTKKMKKAPL